MKITPSYFFPPLSVLPTIGTWVWIIDHNRNPAARYVRGGTIDRPELSPTPNAQAFIFCGLIWPDKRGPLEHMLWSVRAEIGKLNAREAELQKELADA